MKRSTASVSLAVGLILVSCSAPDAQRSTEEATRQAAKAKQEYDAALRRMVESVAYIGGPLKDLREDQMASVAALLTLTRIVAHGDAIHTTSPGVLGEFWNELDEVCPPIPSPPPIGRGGCLDEQIAYASAMASCEGEGKTEAQCEREAAGKAAAAVLCMMRLLEGVEGVIGRIPGREWPPSPFPWPETLTTSTPDPR